MIYGRTHITPVQELLNSATEGDYDVIVDHGRIIKGLTAQEVIEVIKTKGKDIDRNSLSQELKVLQSILNDENALEKNKELLEAAERFGIEKDDLINIIIRALDDLILGRKSLKDFPAIIRGPDKYGLGLATKEYLAYSHEIMTALADDPYLRTEYLLHEPLCYHLQKKDPKKGHQIARSIQKVLFPENYKGVSPTADDNHPGLTGKLTLFLRELINNTIKNAPEQTAETDTNEPADEDLGPVFDRAGVPILSLNKIGQSFDRLDAAARTSELNGSISRLRGTSQRSIDASRLHFAIPVDVLKNSSDITLTLNRLGRFRNNIPFELVVTGVKKEDIAVIAGLNRPKIKKALDLSESLNITIITEEEIQSRASISQENSADPQIRLGIIKDLYLEKLGQQKLPSNEYMAIATGGIEEEKAQELQNKLKKTLQDNISIRVLVGPAPNKSMFSLSNILNDWLKDIQKGRESTIKIILPTIISPDEMIKLLDQSMKTAWRILIAA